MANVSVGDKVKTNAEYDVYGTHLASFVRTNTYDVIKVSGNKVTIGKGKAVTAVVNENTITVTSGTSTPTVTPTVPEKPTSVKIGKEPAMSSTGIESEMMKLMEAGYNQDEILKYSMRLYGVPHQFTKYCDYRTYDLGNEDKNTRVGRKFIENIMLEAPVVTIIPGKPNYLPAAKDKQGTTYALLSASNGTISGLTAAMTLQQNNNVNEKMRYYDFQQDYYSYTKYVNILCAVAAGFLDLQNEKIDGVELTRYDWKNYRWTAKSYSTATGNVLRTTASAVEGFINNLKTYGSNLISQFNKTTSSKSSINSVFQDNDDSDLLGSLENILTQLNYVQFYVDSNSGASESNSNATADSKLEGILDSGSELFKEIAFIANSGGVDAKEVQEYLDGAVDSLTGQLFGSSNGTVSGMMGRILSSGSNIIKGDNMVFPKIYQNSSYSKRYSVSVDLRTPYGNKLSYFLNILVPLFHLIALAIPKQTTANTYGSPFLVKAFYPGVFACNLGIVESITIEKNPNGDSWTADGFPTNMKVTLDIVDLYSDLNMTPAGDVMLFLSNSSLVEYLATNCGVNLTVPQLKNRVTNFVTTLVQGFETVPDDITMSIVGSFENVIASLAGV